jgi:hypothetical protein
MSDELHGDQGASLRDRACGHFVLHNIDTILSALREREAREAVQVPAIQQESPNGYRLYVGDQGPTNWAGEHMKGEEE